ncbi:putative MFS family arabinose efflux permease [Knoellia remsis]|uniref:Putative MFS family arabinose efflux permease n=1 Tax=Knoellia remsis TaxID=407159 RepID=A0A2T0U6D6_9MICO|nr:MFS transporter [Knoellia remsis]PRY53464.1 putative MFS family arabinose efflux permease [Knoellia remsis]
MTSTPAPRVSLRQFWADLPPAGRWLLSTVAVQTLGRGLTLPFTVIYMHEVRGISLDLAGVLMAVIAVVALIVTAPGGALTDRWGARRMLLIATTSQLVGCVILAFATTPWAFALGFCFIGLNFGISWPAFNALIATIVSGEARQQYFGVNFALVNLGIGLGGVIGGVFADVDNPMSFTWIFLGDAASMLVPIGLLLGPLRHVHGRSERPSDEDAGDEPGTYAAILRQPAVLWLSALTFLAVFVGYGQMEAGFPAFARQVSEVSTSVIGFAFAVNTVVIVTLQFWVLRRISGHRRTRVLLVMLVLWSTAWLALGLTGLVPATVAATVGVLVFHSLFALGETMLQPTIPAITNDMAPDHLRGRYNAVNSGAFQAGTILAPIVAGFLLRHQLGSVFIGMLVVGCVAMVGLALALERRISPAVNGVGPAAGPPEPVGATEAAPSGQVPLA